MGYIAHDMVVVTFGDYVVGSNSDPKVEQWRDSLDPAWQSIIVGPIPSLTNSYITWIMTPDGSKSGWDTSDTGDKIREQFIALFTDGEMPSLFDVVHVTYGGDYRHDFASPLARYG